MFVYVVEFSEFDDHYVVGVYSTRESADIAIDKDAKKELKDKDNYIISYIRIDS